MDKELLERLKKLDIESIIWLILISIIILSFYANEIERNYLISKQESNRVKYRNLQTFIFIVAFLIYLYYAIDGYRDILALTPQDSREKVDNTYLAFISSILILLAGGILIYISLRDKDIEIELALN